MLSNFYFGSVCCVLVSFFFYFRHTLRGRGAWPFFFKQRDCPFKETKEFLQQLDALHQEAFEAVQLGQLDKFRDAINRGFEPDYRNPYDAAGTALHIAARKGYPDIVQFLIEIKANVNAHDNLGRVPLILTENEKVAELLIENGADIEATDFNLWRPLHWAVKHNSAELINLLLRSGADPNAIDIDGNTAAHVCAEYGRFHLLKYLLHSLKGNLCNGNNQTVFDLARLRTQSHQDSTRIQELLAVLEDMAGPPVPLASLPVPREHNTSYLMILKDYSTYLGSVGSEKAPQDAEEAFRTLAALEGSSQKDEFLEELLTKLAQPPIHPTADGHFECDVAFYVRQFLNHLLGKAAEMDPRFVGTLHASGSVAEGSKLGGPDEFDFLYGVDNLSDPSKFRVTFLATEDNEKPLGFVNVTVLDGALRRTWAPFLSAENQLSYRELNNYFRVLLWEAGRRLEALNRDGLTFRKTFIFGDIDHKYPESALPLVQFMPAGCKLLLRWQQTGLNINVDIVPSIKVSGWPEQQVVSFESLKSVVASPDGLSYAIVPKTHMDGSVEGSYSWQLSFSPMEKLIISKASEKQKKVFRVLKILKNLLQETKIDRYEKLSSYHMKMTFIRFLIATDKEAWHTDSLSQLVIEALSVLRGEIVRNKKDTNRLILHSFFIPGYSVAAESAGADEVLRMLETLESALFTDSEVD